MITGIATRDALLYLVELRDKEVARPNARQPRHGIDLLREQADVLGRQTSCVDVGDYV